MDVPHQFNEQRYPDPTPHTEFFSKTFLYADCRMAHDPVRPVVSQQGKQDSRTLPPIAFRWLDGLPALL
jgi:hypothetical protein